MVLERHDASSWESESLSILLVFIYPERYRIGPEFSQTIALNEELEEVASDGVFDQSENWGGYGVPQSRLC